ncbi:MAG TPA: hypothetical protein VFO07_13770 [Roseiflexaceae bacterium]|nr:hypothetical protein [Roseiflexaceae bacterium]
MSIITLEGIVEQGQIRLVSDVQLPDNTRVYVVIPGLHVEQVARIFTPRLAHPAQATDFVLEVVEEPSDASL